jgi:aldehyde dehydrogenase (NAD+)
MIEPEHRLYIDGEFTLGSGNRSFDNINPANEAVIGSVPNATLVDMERAIKAARRAFDSTTWSTDHEFRRQCLIQLQQGIRKVAESLRPIVVAETGAPVASTYGIQLDAPIEFITHYINLLESYEWERAVPLDNGEDRPSQRMVRRESAGVVGVITPWNAPFYLDICKITAAVAAGCTVVLKPAPETSYVALILGEVIEKYTDIPAGVVNIVTTSDLDVASVLTTHPSVDAITLTGSTATGRKVMAAAASTIKRVTLELGGKSPAILLDDADFAPIAKGLAQLITYHAGQVCTALSRVLVSENRHDELIEHLSAAMSAIPWGDPTDMANIMGPVVNKKQQTSILRFYDLAKTSGRVVLGGGTGDRFDKGYWVEPTLVTNLDVESPVAQEEIFGPILTVQRYTDIDDAVRIANSTVYGLAAAVFSADQDRAIDIAARLRSGIVDVNGGMSFHVSAPFGGYKQSGLGREWGTEGFEEFLETKTIAFPYRATATRKK